MSQHRSGLAASTLDGTYPRPQLVRAEWSSLDGVWSFGYDDEDQGLAQGWFTGGPSAAAAFDRDIVVPFPPESMASGVNDPGFHPVVWYRRVVSEAEMPRRRTPADRVLVHFGAVDYRATVWCDGVEVGEHEGGQTPFAVDITEPWEAGRDEHVIVVRVHDDSSDAAQPTGKQDWQLEPHEIWYQRTTGIWQTVWMELVATTHIADVIWVPDVGARSVLCEVRLSDASAMRLDVTLSYAGRELSRTVLTTDGRARVELDVAGLAGGPIEDLLWRPERPALVDASLLLRDGATQEPIDAVGSYFGMRSVDVANGRFLLNGEPCYVRSVLDQGYWPDTHLASRGSEFLRQEVELILELGFNTVRMHQKAEDPRFLYWADRLGLMVWGETANARKYSDRAACLLAREWADLVRRDRSHPSIVTWVPMNESWGIDEVATSERQQAFAMELASLTRALDPSRPVISNDGWEHVDSDIIGIHDYTARTWRLLERYGGNKRLRRTLRSEGRTWLDRVAGRSPRRRLFVTAEQWRRFDAEKLPVMLTEFGGVKFADEGGTWGYSTVASTDEYEAVLRRLFNTVRSCRSLSGFCYTQLLDTHPEANGLLTADRTPKLPIETIREIVAASPEESG